MAVQPHFAILCEGVGAGGTWGRAARAKARYLALVKRRIAVPQSVIFFNQLPDERQPIPRDGRDPFCEASGDGMVNYDLIL